MTMTVSSVVVEEDGVVVVAVRWDVLVWVGVGTGVLDDDDADEGAATGVDDVTDDNDDDEGAATGVDDVTDDNDDDEGAAPGVDDGTPPPLPFSIARAASGSLHRITTASALLIGSATQISLPSQGTVAYLPSAPHTPCVREPRHATLPDTHGESGVSAANAALSCLA